MGLRILGAAMAALLASFAAVRYRRGLLRRGELLAIGVVAAGLMVAALAPALLDPLLGPLGFEHGGEQRIIGLLVLSNLFTLALVFRGFTRDDLVADEVGSLVDSLALNRMLETQDELPTGGIFAVIPAHNEAENLGAVLDAMPASIKGLSVTTVVVADGCTDDTEDIAVKHGAVVIRRELRRGSGAAVRLGYKAALDARARLVVTLDADGQHDPGEIEALVIPILEDRANMVQGSRILGSFEEERPSPGMESRARHHGIRIFAKLLTALSRTKITDPSTGYRAMTAEALGRLDLRQDQFYVSELILDAARKGVRVTEVPITIRRRSNGVTKKPATMRYAWGFSKAIVRTWLR